MTIIQNAAKIISNKRNRLKTQKRKYCCLMRIAAHICWPIYWAPKQCFPSVDVYLSNLWHFREWIPKYIDNRNTHNFLNNKTNINTIQIFSGYNRRQHSSCMQWEILSTTILIPPPLLAHIAVKPSQRYQCRWRHMHTKRNKVIRGAIKSYPKFAISDFDIHIIFEISFNRWFTEQCI